MFCRNETSPSNYFVRLCFRGFSLIKTLKNFSEFYNSSKTFYRRFK
ncbi:hypothetical protein HMPREF9554_00977 [Treponema phagedenis F0421]|nr:hypothetical protein HMPREF9554_00977 [Treponema phagedenis F0421]